MSNFVGIQIVAPKKDAFSPIKKYEAQMLSTSDSLVEKDRGEVKNSNVPHSTKDALPLAFASTIIDGNKRGALRLATINTTHLVLTGSQFYRIFENKQEPFIYYSSLSDEDYMIADYKLSANLTPPAGWLECNGQAVSRVTYVDLYNIIGTSFGSGDGSTTFNLPNFKAGRTPMHRDTGVAAFDTLGETGGATTQTLSAANHAVHTHIQNQHTHTTPSGSGINKDMGGGSQYGPNQLGSWYQRDGTLNNTTATNQNQGSATAFSIMNPYQVAGIWLIKATN